MQQVPQVIHAEHAMVFDTKIKNKFEITMKNLQIIKQQRGDLSISNDIDTIRNVFPAGAYLLSGDDAGYDLDETHKLQKGENGLIIISAVRQEKHSLVICSQGAFFDDVKVW